MKKILFILCLIHSFMYANEIKIAVAANVGFVFDELQKEFAKSSETKVVTILGSSGKLSTKIRNGAKYDMFLSADMFYPQKLYEDGFSKKAPKEYAKGKLVLLSREAQDFSKGLDVLNSKNIKKIAIGNTKSVPYGKAAFEAIQKSGLEKKTEQKLVYAQSIAQVASYTLNVADIGFLAKSSLFSDSFSKYKEGVNYIEVEQSLYSPIIQGAIITSFGEGKKGAKEFYDFLFSKNAKEIFRKYGYGVDE